MSGNYSRKLYDDCFQENIIKTSKGPGTYWLHPDQKSNEPCLAPQSVLGQKDNFFNPYRVNDIGHNVNIESHLKRIDLTDSHCSQGRTLAEMNTTGKHLESKLTKKTNKNCNRNLESSFSRLEHPVIDVKSMTTSRFDFPIEDPRGQVFYGMTDEQSGDSRFGINSRLDARDMDPVDYYKKIETRENF